MSKVTRRQRLKRDPMNQTRGKVKAWARRAGCVLDVPVVKSRRPMILGFLAGFFHPNRRARRAYARRYDGQRYPVKQ